MVDLRATAAMRPSSLSRRERVPARSAGGCGVMVSRIAMARRLRRDQTDAERMLWFKLRDRRLAGLKFRRQMPIDSHIADFCCESAGLIVELDGGQHVVQHAADAERTSALEARGYLVLRFNDVLSNMDGVLQTIIETARPVPPHPNPLPDGERERT